MVAPPQPSSRVVWVLLAGVTAGLMGIQYSTLPKIQRAVLAGTDGVLFRGVADNALANALGALPAIMGPADVLCAAILVCSLGGLVVSEAWRGALSAFLVRIVERPGELFAFLVLLGVLSARYLLNPGDVFVRNAESYGPSAWMVAENLRQRQWPVWSNYWYAGYPLLHYYAPAYFVLVAVVYLVAGDIHVATKAVLLLCHVGSVVLMFLYLREALRQFLPALLGAIAYAFIFYRLNLVLYKSDFIQSLVLLVYPALFYGFERYSAGRLSGKRAVVWTALCVAALIVTHHAYAFFGLVFFALYALIRLASGVTLWPVRLRTLAVLALSAVAGVLIGGFSLLPYVLDRADVRGLEEIPFDHLVPWPPLWGLVSQLLEWQPTGLGAATLAYIGISLVGLALVAAVYSVRTRHSVGLALVACAVYALFTARGGSYYNTKNLTFFVFFLCALAALAPVAIAHWSRRPRWLTTPERLLLACAALLVVDFGPMTFQQTFMPNRSVAQDAVLASLLGKDPSARVLERRVVKYDQTKSLAENFEPDRLGIISAYAPVHIPLGRFHEGAALSISYFSEMIKQIDLDLNQGALSDTALASLYLMNVKFFTFRDRDHYFAPPIAPAEDYAIEDSVLVFTRVRPLLASLALTHVDDIPGYDANNVIERRKYFDPDMTDYRMPHYGAIITPLLRDMRIDPRRGTAERLIVRGQAPRGTSRTPGELQITVGAVDVTIDTARIEYTSSTDAYGQLAFSYFPYLDVRIDGGPTEFYRSAIHTIVLPLRAGQHVISIKGRASVTRKVTFATSVVALLGLLLVPARWLRALDAGAR